MNIIEVIKDITKAPKDTTINYQYIIANKILNIWIANHHLSLLYIISYATDLFFNDKLHITAAVITPSLLIQYIEKVKNITFYKPTLLSNQKLDIEIIPLGEFLDKLLINNRQWYARWMSDEIKFCSNDQVIISIGINKINYCCNYYQSQIDEKQCIVTSWNQCIDNKQYTLSICNYNILPFREIIKVTSHDGQSMISIDESNNNINVIGTANIFTYNLDKIVKQIFNITLDSSIKIQTEKQLLNISLKELEQINNIDESFKEYFNNIERQRQMITFNNVVKLIHRNLLPQYTKDIHNQSINNEIDISNDEWNKNSIIDIINILTILQLDNLKLNSINFIYLYHMNEISINYTTINKSTGNKIIGYSDKKTGRKLREIEFKNDGTFIVLVDTLSRSANNEHIVYKGCYGGVNKNIPCVVQLALPANSRCIECDPFKFKVDICRVVDIYEINVLMCIKCKVNRAIYYEQLNKEEVKENDGIIVEVKENDNQPGMMKDMSTQTNPNDYNIDENVYCNNCINKDPKICLGIIANIKIQKLDKCWSPIHNKEFCYELNKTIDHRNQYHLTGCGYGIHVFLDTTPIINYVFNVPPTSYIPVLNNNQSIRRCTIL